jgi:hypothetical protein
MPNGRSCRRSAAPGAVVEGGAHGRRAVRPVDGREVRGGTEQRGVQVAAGAPRREADQQHVLGDRTAVPVDQAAQRTREGRVGGREQDPEHQQRRRGEQPAAHQRARADERGRHGVRVLGRADGQARGGEHTCTPVLAAAAA